MKTRSKKTAGVIGVTIFLFLPFFVNATTYYVTPAGAGLLDGSSWTNAAVGDDLQNIINFTAAGDEVWVAAGTYRTTSGTNRSISFSMKNDVAVYGSFSGSETLLTQRNLTSGLTSILSAEIGAAGNSDNSYHTIHNTGLNATALIDGFIIQDANDNRAATLTAGLGGGIYNDGSAGNCSPTIRNCVITNNRAVFGAGIFNSGYYGVSNPVLINCVIASNFATTGGGGIDNFGVGGNASPVLTNCVIYNNSAVQRAGGMYCWGGENGNASPVVLNSVFANNNAVDGGAVVCDNLNVSTGNSGNSDPVFRNCIFRGNTATGIGPQFFVLGSATFNATYSDIELAGQTPPHIISGAGTGNFDADPLFTDPANGAGIDGDWITLDDGLQLQSASPCVDTGDNAGTPVADILGNPRISGSAVDLGAYEYQGISTALHDADLNNDFSVYPNPSHGIFIIETNSNAAAIPYMITDVTGKIITSGMLNEKRNMVNLSDAADGIYFMQLRDKTIRLVKQ
jgi:hypothetical protein